MLTTVPPATEVRTAGLTFTPFRPATIESETLIARARTVSSGATFTFAEVLVEDALGREVLRASGVALVEPMADPPPAAAIPGEPVPEPRYPSPDPYRRPLPTGVGVFPPSSFERHHGLTLGAKMAVGELPRPPVMELFGLRGVEIEDRRSRMALPTSDWLCWRRRDRIAPAAVAALAYRALVTSPYSEVRPGHRLGPLAVSISLLADVANDGTELVAEGRVTDFKFEDRGHHRLKGIDGEWPLFAVVN